MRGTAGVLLIFFIHSSVRSHRLQPGRGSSEQGCARLAPAVTTGPHGLRSGGCWTSRCWRQRWQCRPRDGSQDAVAHPGRRPPRLADPQPCRWQRVTPSGGAAGRCTRGLLGLRDTPLATLDSSCVFRGPEAALNPNTKTLENGPTLARLKRAPRSSRVSSTTVPAAHTTPLPRSRADGRKWRQLLRERGGRRFPCVQGVRTPLATSVRTRHCSHLKVRTT